MSDVFVFDTNVFLSALLFKNSKPTFEYDKAKEIGHIAASEATHAEFCEVFLRPKFDKYIALEGRQLLLDALSKNLVFTKIKKTVTACRDPKDNKFLELAISAKASCIITGDEDLLVLNPFRKIPILNASDFLIQL